MTEQSTEIQKGDTVYTKSIAEVDMAQPILPTYKSEIAKFFPTAGTLKLTNKQTAILRAPIEPEQVLIRPDGEGQLYMHWSWYAERLFNAFGAQVAFLEDEPPAMKGNLLIRSVHLIVQGCYITHAYGEQVYHPNNPKMTYGDTIEGALSNAKSRCCKAFGMVRELWDENFREDWKRKYAYQYVSNEGRSKGKYVWGKKGAKVEVETVAEANTSKAEKLKEDIEAAKKTKYGAYLSSMQKEKARVGETAYYKVLGNHGYAKSNEITDLKTQRLVYGELIKLPAVVQVEEPLGTVVCDGCGEMFPVNELSVRHTDNKMYCREKCWGAIVEEGIAVKKGETNGQISRYSYRKRRNTRG